MLFGTRHHVVKFSPGLHSTLGFSTPILGLFRPTLGWFHAILFLHHKAPLPDFANSDSDPRCLASGRVFALQSYPLRHLFHELCR